jgi:ATP-dependent phosphoenolpyruvate carboxykinase
MLFIFLSICKIKSENMAQISDELYNLLIMSRNLKNKRNIINSIIDKAIDDKKMDIDLILKMQIKKQEIGIEYMSIIDETKKHLNDSQYLSICNKLKMQYDINGCNINSLNKAKKASKNTLYKLVD